MSESRADIAPVLVTGTTGFIGTALTKELRRRGVRFRHALRVLAELPERLSWLAASVRRIGRTLCPACARSFISLDARTCTVTLSSMARK